MNRQTLLALCLGCIVLLTRASAEAFVEDFSHAPSEPNWQVHGDPTFFQWNEAGHLDVTWDSSQTNSFFIHPLNSVLGRDDDFTVAFEMTLESVGYVSDDGATTTFEIAIGLIHQADATGTDFDRAAGVGVVRNLVEFDYFPDNGFGDTIWPSIWSTNATLNYTGANDYALATLPLNTPLAITMDFESASGTLTTSIHVNDQPLVSPIQQTLTSTFADFRVDAFAISSYQLDGDAALLAHGSIDNIRLTYPLPVPDLIITRSENSWTTRFTSRTNWTYQLEESTDLETWSATGNEVAGTGEAVELSILRTDPFVFTRVRATRR